MYLYTQVRTRHLLDTKLRQQSARAEGICQVNTHIDLVALVSTIFYFYILKLNNRPISDDYVHVDGAPHCITLL